MPTHQANTRRNTELALFIAAAVPVFLLYAMYLMNMSVELNLTTLAVPIGLTASFALAHVATRKFAPGADPAILPIVFLLSGIGIAFVTRLAPDLALGQVIWLFVSVAAMILTLALVPSVDKLAEYKFTMGIAGVILLLLPMVIGTEHGGSKLWLSFGPFSFQPGELAKILIVLFLASYLAENRELLSASTRRIGPLALPRPKMLAPLLVMWGISLLLVIFERDLGSALLFFTFFVVMIYVCTGRVSYVIFSVALLVIGGVACYMLFSHVQVRIQIWLDPFADASNKGLQIVQSLFSLADGKLFGTGIGKGLPTLIPVVESDFIFPAMGEELGLLGGSAILICYMLFAVRGFVTAARAKTDIAAFTAAGLTVAIAFQAFLIVGGTTRLLPLTGVTLPFMSQGGSSLLASFIIVGLLLKTGDEGTGHGAQIENAATPQTATYTHAAGGGRGRAVVQGAHARGRFSLNTAESGVLGRVALGKRLVALVTVFTVAFALLIANLTYIQVIQAEHYQNAQQQPHDRQVGQGPARRHHHLRRRHPRREHPRRRRHLRPQLPARQRGDPHRGLPVHALRRDGRRGRLQRDPHGPLRLLQLDERAQRDGRHRVAGRERRAHPQRPDAARRRGRARKLHGRDRRARPDDGRRARLRHAAHRAHTRHRAPRHPH